MKRPLPILALSVLAAAIAFAMSPWLSGGFAGFSPAQFPVKQDFWPVQPAGWAFSIWGVIYTWLIFGAVWGLINAPHNPNWRPMRQLLLVSLGVGAFWVMAANASPVLATFMIVAMAVLAITAMMRAGLENPAWQVRPVALYAGWLTAATGVGAGVGAGVGVGVGVGSSSSDAGKMPVSAKIANVAPARTATTRIGTHIRAARAPAEGTFFTS